MIALVGLLALADALIWATDPVVETGRLSVSLAGLIPALGVAAVAAVVVRRRHSVQALVALGAASIAMTIVCVAVRTSLPPSFAAVFALGLLDVVVLRNSSGRAAASLCCLAALAVAGEAVRPQVSGAGYLLAIAAVGFSAAVGVGVYLRWSDWHRAAAARQARDEERLEIARELHDLVGHHLTGIVVQAQAARHVAGRRPEAAVDALDQISREGSEALAALRWTVSALREGRPVGSGWEDVERLARAAGATGLGVTISLDPTLAPLSEAEAPVVYRVVAEAVTNVHRHGHGVSHVHVEAAVDHGSLVVTVGDDGSPQTGSVGGSGIIGLRQRVEDLGGTLEAGPAATGGWVVRAELPAGPSR